MGSGGPRRSGIWSLIILLLVAVVLQGCPSNNTDRSGPSFPAGQSGATDAGLLAVISASAGPGGGQFTIVVIVTSGFGGRPVAGSPVILTTTAGRLNVSRGVTDANGEFTAILTCRAAGEAPFVQALVQGLLLAVTVTCP